MSTDQIIALTTSIGACLSAIATFLTVRQIKKQREDSYRPELAFSSSFFTATVNSDGGVALPLSWRITPASNAGSTGESVAIPLRNVGLGAAKNVVIEWSFALEEAIKRINITAQKALSAAYFKFDELGVSFESEKLGKMISMWRNQQRSTFDFVLPASVDKQPAIVSLPHAFVLVASAVPFFGFKIMHESNSAAFDLPKLTAMIDFNDIGGKVHHSQFDLRIEIASISEDAFDGRFVWNKIT